jgi:hypothetical protein
MIDCEVPRAVRGFCPILLVSNLAFDHGRRPTAPLVVVVDVTTGPGGHGVARRVGEGE